MILICLYLTIRLLIQDYQILLKFLIIKGTRYNYKEQIFPRAKSL